MWMICTFLPSFTVVRQTFTRPSMLLLMESVINDATTVAVFFFDSSAIIAAMSHNGQTHPSELQSHRPMPYSLTASRLPLYHQFFIEYCIPRLLIPGFFVDVVPVSGTRGLNRLFACLFSVSFSLFRLFRCSHHRQLRSFWLVDQLFSSVQLTVSSFHFIHLRSGPQLIVSSLNEQNNIYMLMELGQKGVYCSSLHLILVSF